MYFADGIMLPAGQMTAYNDGNNFTGENEHICQYTGFNNMNYRTTDCLEGAEIYEGHILENDKGERGLVVWYEAGFHLECKRKGIGVFFYIPLSAGMLKNKSIIGHYLLNPELLEK